MNIREQLKLSLQASDPVLMDLTEQGHAAVAVVLRFENSTPDVLLIQRAENINDPWSGHLALPGGRVEPEDVSPQQTAEREAFEETGIILEPEDYLGRMSDTSAAGVPVVVSCYVYAYNRDVSFILDTEEVADAFWIPISIMDDPMRALTIEEKVENGTQSFPAVKVPGKSQPLWGMTLALLKDLTQSFHLTRIR